MDDHREFGVDVKVQKAPRPGDADKLTEAELEGVWNAVTGEFWAVLELRAKSDIPGIEEVFCEGRMGGWAVPYPHLIVDSPEFLKFERLCDETVEEFLTERWPQAVTEQVERKEAEARDPFIEIRLRRSAVATVAGMVAETDDIQEIVNDEDGGAQDQVTASTETWNEIREAFPLDTFKAHGDWFGKDEEEE